jgi:hypothetical protein
MEAGMTKMPAGFIMVADADSGDLRLQSISGISSVVPMRSRASSGVATNGGGYWIASVSFEDLVELIRKAER